MHVCTHVCVSVCMLICTYGMVSQFSKNISFIKNLVCKESYKKIKSDVNPIIYATYTADKFSRQLPIVPHCWKINYSLWSECSPVL